jgi:VWFA-related protein
MRISTLLLAAALASAATAPAATQTEPQPPVFRSSSDLVEVDVIVRDRSGRFISDLAPADFEILEQGAAQPIQQFFLHITTSNGWPVDTSPGAAQPVAVPASPEGARRTFIVLFDSAHMSVGGSKRVQTAAIALFTQHFRSGDIGGVISDGRVANNRLTSDREELLKSVRNVKPSQAQSSRLFDEQQWPRLTEPEAMRIAAYEDKPVLNAAVTRACADDENACRVMDVPGLVRQKATMLADAARASTNATLQNLNALVSGLARIEGRKTVLLLSEGFIADNSWPLVKQTVESAVRSNTRVYTLDARGLDRGMSQRLAAASPGDDDPGLNLLNNDPGSDSINSLAVDTGGFVVRNTNAFDRAIAQIVDDASNYYVLGYRPVTPQDGKFHQITVKVNRPGVGVRARRGYIATPRPAVSITAEAHSDPGAQVNETVERAVAVPEPIADRGNPAASPIARPEPVDRPLSAGVARSTAAPASGTTVTSPAGAVRVRPAAAEHVGDLVTGTTEDTDAKAGWSAYQRGDVETARASLSVAAARPAADAWVHYALGMSEYALGHYAAAIAAWEKVRDGATDFEPVYFDLVDGYMQLKDYDKAVRLLRGAKDKWPRDPEVFNALGVVQTVRGALDDAIKSFEGAIAVAPAETTSYFNLGKAHELRYFRSRHYVQQTRLWMANESDRTAAIQHYEQYLASGGPYAQSARDGLARLRWLPDQKD